MPLTDAQIQQLMRKDAYFRRLVQQYGMPKSVPDCGHGDAKPGDICMESPCRNGTKDVMYCNESNGCTGHGTVTCDPADDAGVASTPQAPTSGAPAKKAPAKKAPAKNAPAKGAPARKAAPKKGPAKPAGNPRPRKRGA